MPRRHMLTGFGCKWDVSTQLNGAGRIAAKLEEIGQISRLLGLDPQCTTRLVSRFRFRRRSSLSRLCSRLAKRPVRRLELSEDVT
jgi:hypothetical protein